MKVLHPLVTQFHRNCETVKRRRKDGKLPFKSLKNKTDSGKLIPENRLLKIAEKQPISENR